MAPTAAIANDHSPRCRAQIAIERAKTKKQGRLRTSPVSTSPPSLRLPWAVTATARAPLIVGKAATAPPATGPAARLTSVEPSTAAAADRQTTTTADGLRGRDPRGL
jgi:hypothetical protein